MDQPDLDQREQTMQRDVLLVATAAISLVNGQGFSPFFDPVFFLLRPFIAGTFLATPLVLFYLTSIFISLMTLLIAGIPAAIYDRIRGNATSSVPSIALWLVCTILLTVPTGMAYFNSN